MRVTKQQLRKFDAYVGTWRRIFVDVLGWQDKDLEKFVQIQKARLYEAGAQEFFHDTAYKIACWKLVKAPGTGLQGYPGARLLLRALAGGIYCNIGKKDFDSAAGRRRYDRALAR